MSTDTQKLADGLEPILQQAGYVQPDASKAFCVIQDMQFDGEGWSIGILVEGYYQFTDGDCYLPEVIDGAMTLDGWTALFMTHYEFEQWVNTKTRPGF